MKITYNYLNDTSFLKELAKQHIKTYYVKISVLNWEESPISFIEGRVISGNLNIDGQSSLRRTANLSIALDDTMYEITNVENLLSLNKKMCLEIGYVNTTKKYLKYPILWFPLGIYIIISCSVSESSSGLVASLQLQDKMCLLNGTVSGKIPAAADLHMMDTLDENGKWITVYPTIYQIIQELVHHWGDEQLGKIIISDLDNKVKQAMKWNLDKPLFFVETASNDRYFLDESQYQNYIKECQNNNISYSTRIFNKNQDVGFIYTDFIYPGELIADAGSSVSDMLDKIIQVLGNYEYFYDLDGNFIFQEKKNYLNNSQSTYIKDAAISQDSPSLVPDYIAAKHLNLSSYLIDLTSGTSVFEFEDGTLITSYSNTPQYGAIKNDFTIWGIRTGTDGLQVPIRYHLVLDVPPALKIGRETIYKMFNYKEYSLDKYGIWKMPTIVLNEIQEIQYGNPRIVFQTEPEPSLNYVGKYYYYYKTNILKTVIQNENTGNWQWQELDYQVVDIVPSDWRTKILIEGAAAQNQGLDYSYYYEQLKNEWPKIYDVKAGKYYDEVIKNPSSINYYLDFISSGNAKIMEMSVKNIGRRSFIDDKGKNVNCIFEDWIPDVILIKAGENGDKRDKRFSQVPVSIYNNLAIGGVHYSAYEEIRQMLHEFTNFNETISIQTIPLYFLEPNTRITVNNSSSNIKGDYLINSLSFSLENEGTLTINASKAIERV